MFSTRSAFPTPLWVGIYSDLPLAVDVVVTLIAVALIWTGRRPRPAVAQPSAPVGIAPVARRTRA
jgi:hypothetical protein